MINLHLVKVIHFAVPTVGKKLTWAAFLKVVLEILTFLKVFGREFQNPVIKITKVPPSSDLQLKGA